MKKMTGLVITVVVSLIGLSVQAMDCSNGVCKPKKSQGRAGKKGAERGPLRSTLPANLGEVPRKQGRTKQRQQFSDEECVPCGNVKQGSKNSGRSAQDNYDEESYTDEYCSCEECNRGGCDQGDCDDSYDSQEDSNEYDSQDDSEEESYSDCEDNTPKGNYSQPRRGRK